SFPHPADPILTGIANGRYGGISYRRGPATSGWLGSGSGRPAVHHGAPVRHFGKSPAWNFTTALVYALANAAVASRPERARRTGGPFVIDAFFVWTADNPVSHHDGSGSGPVDEREHFFCNAGIIADIGPSGKPAPKIRDVGILSRHDADSEL